MIDRVPVIGEVVDHYKLIRRIGKGGMGEVHLARDLHLGRKVALKFLRAEELGDELALFRFIKEAQITARFAHPHIVSIFGVGLHGGNPYLALEHLEGQTLTQRLKQGKLSSRECMRIGEAVAKALTEAHSHGVLHRDLKPSNVFLPQDGRVRVMDFGIAKVFSETEASTSATSPQVRGLRPRRDSDDNNTTQIHLVGTPRYMAPEQWTCGQLTQATDVWALGVVLYEMLLGEHPLLGVDKEEIFMAVVDPAPIPRLPDDLGFSQALVELVQRCLDKDPEQRPTASEVSDALVVMLSGSRTLTGSDESPFRGLLSFSERHAELFFGRKVEVESFVERLRNAPVLPVVGPSGAGKTSFVQAGVIPRLREQKGHTVLKLRPGQRPLEALVSTVCDSSEKITSAEVNDEPTRPLWGIQGKATEKNAPALSVDITSPEQLRRALEETPAVLAVVLHNLAERTDSQVLLFVDQLEEVFTLASDPAERRIFMESVCAASDDPSLPVRVVLALREDFLGRAVETAAAKKVFSRIEVLRSPGPAALRDIIVKPVEMAGYEYESSEVPDRAVAAVEDEPACLPILEFACSRLWQRRDLERRLIPDLAYDAMGGVEGAIAQHADELIDSMLDGQIDLARQLFLRLVTPEGTRQVISRAKLLEGLAPEAESVLKVLTDERAIVARRRGDDEEGQLELVHESLITAWHRLAAWLLEDRDKLAMLHEITQATELWQKRGQRDSELWTGDALREARLGVERCSVIPDDVEVFLREGERKQAMFTMRRRALFSAVVLVLAVVALIFAGLASRAEDNERAAEEGRVAADQARVEAEHRRAEALLEGARVALHRGDLLEARARLRTSMEVEGSALARALLWRISSEPLLWHADLPAEVYAAAIDPDGKTVAAACGTSVYLFDAQTRDAAVLRGHDSLISALTYSRDGTLLVAGTTTGRLARWNLATKRFQPFGQHTGVIDDIRYSRDGALIATTARDGQVKLWDGESFTERMVIVAEIDVRSVDFSPDGTTLLAAGCDQSIRIFEVATGRLMQTLDAHPGGTREAAFSPDGTLVATVGYDSMVKLWSTETWEVETTLRGHTDRVIEVAWSIDGRVLASGGNDGTIRIWDVVARREQAMLPGHSSRVTDVAFDRSGQMLISASQDRTVKVWNTGNARPAPSRTGGHKAATDGLRWSPDGRVLASTGYDGTARLWDVERGSVSRVLRHESEMLGVLAFDPEGEVLATADDKALRLWDTATGASREVLHGHASEIWEIGYLEPGTPVTVSADRTVRFWDLDTGTAKVVDVGTRLRGLDIDAGRGLIATSAEGGMVHLLDARSGAILRSANPHKRSATGVRFLPDGSGVVTGGRDESVCFWDLQSSDTRVLARLDAAVWELDVHPTTALIAAPTDSGAVHLLDASGLGKAPRRIHGHRGGANSARFSPDGQLLATAGSDGTVRVWETESGRALWRAPLLAGNPPSLLTHRGWEGLDGMARSEPNTAWARAAAEGARLAALDEEGGHLCSATWDGSVEIWDTDEDRRLCLVEGIAPEHIITAPSGCIIRSGSTLSLVDLEGELQTVAEGVRAIERDRERLLVATTDRLLVLTLSGERLAERTTSVGVTALTPVGERLAFGFADGGVEVLRSENTSNSHDRLRLEDPPPAAVVRLLSGPGETIIVGHANGAVSLHSLVDGSLVFRQWLHGSVQYLLLRTHRLYAASDLGQYLTLDLELLAADRCTVLRRVWDTIPNVWERGRPISRAAPESCSSHPTE